MATPKSRTTTAKESKAGPMTIHIMPKGIDGWLLKVEGGKMREGFFATREEALRVGTTMSDTLRAELLIHNRDGTTTRH